MNKLMMGLFSLGLASSAMASNSQQAQALIQSTINQLQTIYTEPAASYLCRESVAESITSLNQLNRLNQLSAAQKKSVDQALNVLASIFDWGQTNLSEQKQLYLDDIKEEIKLNMSIGYCGKLESFHPIMTNLNQLSQLI